MRDSSRQKKPWAFLENAWTAKILMAKCTFAAKGHAQLTDLLFNFRQCGRNCTSALDVLLDVLRFCQFSLRPANSFAHPELEAEIQVLPLVSLQFKTPFEAGHSGQNNEACSMCYDQSTHPINFPCQSPKIWEKWKINSVQRVPPLEAEVRGTTYLNLCKNCTQSLLL